MSSTSQKTTDKPQTGTEAVAEAASNGSDTSPKAATNALAYFMGDEPAPGATDEFTLEVDFGNFGDPRPQEVTFRTLTADEIGQAEDRAIRKDSMGRDQGIDQYTRACWIMARAQIEPAIGPIVQQRNEAGGKFRDAAHLIHSLFERAPGTVMRIEQVIRRRSRMDVDDVHAVREIEAGKP